MLRNVESSHLPSGKNKSGKRFARCFAVGLLFLGAGLLIGGNVWFVSHRLSRASASPTTPSAAETTGHVKGPVPPPSEGIPMFIAGHLALSVAAMTQSVRKVLVDNIIQARQMNDSLPLMTDTGCSAAESLDGDTKHPLSDCHLLQTEFGMCHAYLGTKSNLTYGDIDEVRTPFAQGYITVEGLEDPLVVANTMYEEAERAHSGLGTLWPLCGVDALVAAKGGQRSALRIDVVFTFVDGAEKAFVSDFHIAQRHEEERAASKGSRVGRNDYLQQLKAPSSSKGKQLLTKVLWAALENYLPEVSILDPPASRDAKAAPNRLAFNPGTAETTAHEGHAETDTPHKTGRQYLFENFKLAEEIAGDGFHGLRAGDRNINSEAALHKLPDAKANRFRSFDELRYTLRGIFRNIIAPMEEAARLGKGRVALGKIFIVVSHQSQAPPWLKASPYIELVEHRDLFPDPRRSLPTFNSRAIESVLHRIKGLSRHYIYLNNDFMLARPVSFFDFFQPYAVQEGKGKVIRFLPKILVTGVSRSDCANGQHYGNTDMCMPYGFTVAELHFAHNLYLVGLAANSSKTIGYTLGFSHIPQMYDRLQVMRMLTEPQWRPSVCLTRGSRERQRSNVMTMYAYQHYSLLWRQGWGPLATERVAEMLWPPEAKVTSLDKPQYIETLGLYLNRSDRDTSLASMMADLAKIPPGTEGVVRTPSKRTMMVFRPPTPVAGSSLGGPTTIKVSQTHWLLDLEASLIGTGVASMQRSEQYLFGQVTNLRSAEGYLADIRSRGVGETPDRYGRLLFLVMNDDLPALGTMEGTRMVKEGLWSGIPSAVIESVCSWSDLEMKLAAVQLQRAGRAFLVNGKHIFKLHSYEDIVVSSADLAEILFDSKVAWCDELLYSQAPHAAQGPPKSTLKDTEVVEQLMDLLQAACGLFSMQQLQEVILSAGERTAQTQPSVLRSLGNNISKTRSKEFHAFVRNESLWCSAKTALPTPSDGAYGAEGIVAAYRLASGDCDEGLTSLRTPPWEGGQP